MTRTRRLDLDESKIITKEEQEANESTLSYVEEQQANATPTPNDVEPYIPQDEYKTFEKEAAEILESHRLDSGFIRNPEAEINQTPAKTVYNFEHKGVRNVTIVRGALRKTPSLVSSSMSDTLHEFVVSNEKEINRVKLELEIHRRLDDGKDISIKNRIRTFEENLNYLLKRRSVLEDIIKEQ